MVSNNYAKTIFIWSSLNNFCFIISLGREPSGWYSRTRYTRASSSNIYTNLSMPSHWSSCQCTLISYIKFIIPPSVSLIFALFNTFTATQSWWNSLDLGYSGGEGVFELWSSMRKLYAFYVLMAMKTLLDAPSPTIFKKLYLLHISFWMTRLCN